jgi:hypothetical protein
VSTCLALVLLFGLIFATPTRAAEKGTITGVVDKPGRVTAVRAIDRTTDKRFSGNIDIVTGRFRIDGLPRGGTYDCILDLKGGRLEGVNLKVPRSEYEEEQPLTKEDIATLKKTARSLNKFEDKVEVLTVTGNVQHAAVLLNKVRLKPFVNSRPGEIIWRLELWHFERPDDTWIKVQDELFLVLYRERIARAAYEKKSLTLDQALGGLKPTATNRVVDVGKVKLPATKPGVRLRSRG